MTAEAKPDLEMILPQGGVIEVAGIEARVRRLKSREFLSLIRVLTTGMGPAIGKISLTPDDPDRLQGELIGLFLVAVPNAIDEFAEFLMSIVEAVKPTDQAALLQEMVNPDPEVLLDVLTVLAEQEKDDLSMLAGKGRAAIARIQTVYRSDG